MVVASRPRLTRELAERIFDAVGRRPNDDQLAIILDPARYKLMAGGVRAGKSHTGAWTLVLKVLEHLASAEIEHGDPGRAGGSVYWLVAADYDRTRAEYEYAGEFFGRLGMLVDMTKQVDPGEMRVSVGGRTGSEKPIVIKTKSAMEYRKLAMEAPRGILACEASQIDQTSFERLQERLAEHRGWLYMSGSFEGSLGWYPAMWTRWQSPAIQRSESAKSFSLPSWTNRVVFPGGRQDPEILKFEREHSADWFNERIAGIPAPPSGLVHPSFSVVHHVREVEFNPEEEVYLAVDPGFSRLTESAYAVMACHVRNNQLQVFDEIYERQFTHEQIVDIAMSKPWWKAGKTGVVDVSGMAHSGAGESAAEVWLRKANLVLHGRHIYIRDQIERMNSLLNVNPLTKEPGIIISPKCKGVLSEFGGAPSKFEEGQVKVYTWRMASDGSVVGKEPRDAYNHGIKALTYLAVHLWGFVSAAPRERIVRRVNFHRGERDLRDVE